MGAVLAAGMLSGLLGLRNSWRIAGDTITIVMLVQKTGSRWELALDRVGEMLLGIVIHEFRLIDYSVYSNCHYINSKLICLPSRC